MVANKKIVLNVVGLSVSYGHVSAVKNANLRVLEGEIVALIGANGAGKSTFLEALLGMHQAMSGSVYFMEKDITNKPTDRIVASGMVICPEGRGILPLMSVLENLQLGAFHHRHAINDSLKQVYEIFPVLSDRKNQAAGTLSGGEQQMLSIGRALMASPKILMLDEPSLGLAPRVINDLFEIIGGLALKGQTILLAEQNARKALQCAERAYVFETGNIVLEGNSDKLLCDEAVIQAYLGGKGNFKNYAP